MVILNLNFTTSNSFLYVYFICNFFKIIFLRIKFHNVIDIFELNFFIFLLLVNVIFNCFGTNITEILILYILFSHYLVSNAFFYFVVNWYMLCFLIYWNEYFLLGYLRLALINRLWCSRNFFSCMTINSCHLFLSESWSFLRQLSLGLSYSFLNILNVQRLC